VNRIVNGLIKRTRESVSKSKLKEEQQYAESLDEIITATNELKKEISSQWGVIDIALTNIESLTNHLHELEFERISLKRRHLITL